MNDLYWQGELDDLLALEEGLTGWEVEFVESVEKRRQDGRDLTDGQIAKIHQIWDRRCK